MHKRRLQEESVGEAFRERLRAKINSTLLVNALTKHVLGKKEMSQSQVSAATTLLRKTLPDLQSAEVKQVGESLADALARLAKLEAQRNQTDSKPVQTEQEQERPAVH